MKKELLEIYNLINELEIKGIRNISIIYKISALLEDIISNENEETLRKEE